MKIKFQNTHPRKIVTGLFLVLIFFSAFGTGNPPVAKAQEAPLRIPSSEAPSPLSEKAIISNSSYVLAATVDLPIFELPYGWDSNIPQTYEPVYWSGGLHKYGDLNKADIISVDLGSGLDFSAGSNWVFDFCERQCSFIVRSMAPGTVIYMTDSLDGEGDDSFGKEIAVKSDIGGSVIIYGHLYNFFPGLSVGSHVETQVYLDIQVMVLPTPMAR